MSLSLDEVRAWCEEARVDLEEARGSRFPRLAALAVRDSAMAMLRRVPEVVSRPLFWQPEPGSELAVLLERWVMARAFRCYRVSKVLELAIRERGANAHTCVPPSYGRASELTHLLGPVLGPYPSRKDRSRHEASELLVQVRRAAAELAQEHAPAPRPRVAKPKLESVVKAAAKLEPAGIDVLMTKHFLERLATRRGDFDVGRFFHLLPKLVGIFRGRSPRAVKIRVAEDCHVVGRILGERLTLITVMPVRGTTEQELSFWHALHNPSTELVDARGDLE